MALITLSEILGMLAITAGVGYVFSGFIQKPRTTIEQLYMRHGFNWEDFKFAAMIAAPAVILHELGHKFVSIALGFPAVLKVFWMGLGIGIVLKIFHAPFLILAPAYVQISSATPGLQTALIAFAGPFVNLVLWLGSSLYLKKARRLSQTKAVALLLSARINKLLFIFNLIPLPPLDGSKVLAGILAAL
ncbi:MAG: hypothetical protein ABIB71_09095 [Candidatus Woesearchaeota archaeon]